MFDRSMVALIFWRRTFNDSAALPKSDLAARLWGFISKASAGASRIATKGGKPLLLLD